MCQFQCFILQIDITAAYRERPEYQENSIPAQEGIERKGNYCALGKSSDVIYIYIYINRYLYNVYGLIYTHSKIIVLH